MTLKYKILVGLLSGLSFCGITQAQNNTSDTRPVPSKDTLLFQFVHGKRMFWADYKGNKESILAMTRLIRTNKPSIESGEIKVRVLGFCSSSQSAKENLAMAKNRSNQVKSYFIVHEGLKEKHFRTTNSTHRWQQMQDVVVVTYLYETKNRESSSGEAENLQDSQNAIKPAISEEKSLPAPDTPSALSDTLPQPDSTSATEKIASSVENSPQQTSNTECYNIEKQTYRWALKTNVAYLAATVANIGIEYRFGKHYSIDVPFTYSPYTVARDYRLRIMAVQPEFRYWLHNPMQGHFLGAHFNLGAFNISVDSKTRYQSPDAFYGFGLSYGYVLPFARHWAAEFSIGAGYIHTKYDSYYNIPNGACFEKGTPYNYWGLTKVGIGLVYRFGK